MEEKVMRRVLMVVLMLLYATPAAALQKNPSVDRGEIEKAVIEVNSRMTQAADSLDAEKFFSYILNTGEGSIIQDGRLFKTWAEALDAVKTSFQGLVKAERRYDQIQVTVISPEVALLISQGSTTASLPDGRTISSRFATSLVFVLRNGQWKVLHGHYSIP
jgi:hypothetical protein